MPTNVKPHFGLERPTPLPAEQQNQESPELDLASDLNETDAHEKQIREKRSYWRGAFVGTEDF